MRVRWLTALLLAAQAGLAQDVSLLTVTADGRAVAEKEIAIAKLQSMLTRPTGPQTTPQQDRISDYITEDYQFVQTHRSRWRGTAYATLFEKAVSAGLRDPELRNEDPVKVSKRKEGQSGDDSDFDWYPWFIGFSFVALILALVWALRRFGIGRPAGSQPPAPTSYESTPYSTPTSNVGWQKELWSNPPANPVSDARAGRPCTVCEGSGRDRCPSCLGKGSWTEPPTTAYGTAQLIRCGMCLSSGKVQCMTCGGSGRVYW